MKLFESIDGLLVGTRYLAWGIGVLGVIGSVILFIANVPLGIGTAAVFVASFSLQLQFRCCFCQNSLQKGSWKAIRNILSVQFRL